MPRAKPFVFEPSRSVPFRDRRVLERVRRSETNAADIEPDWEVGY